ncbi:BPM6 [Symbiodinium natans]|uniref:BPM6 protein n=1 Tax=Symbiodinium natans TaxID=878477 RepID=A0A812QQW4_9DINO|nr:BPM6 [Symbiodinium natans]
MARERNREEAERRQHIDADRNVACDYSEVFPMLLSKRAYAPAARAEECAGWGSKVAKGEYVWKLQQMSWLRTALRQDFLSGAFSEDFQVGKYIFDFVYNPFGGRLASTQKLGSLAIRTSSDEKFALRYSIHIKRRGGDFVQWGETQDALHNGSEKHYGPDVADMADSPAAEHCGIFGLTHDELLQSEWVENDTLTMKFLLEVRCEGVHHYQVTHKKIETVEVPEATMDRDLQALLQEGTCSDVQFRVQGEVVHAHSQLLCARSEVFKKQLTAGMRESVSKVIDVEDCDAATLRALLRFLYTDSFPAVEELAAQPSSEAAREDASRHLLFTQGLWAASHKYQATRLQRWCEAQLCELLSASEVCGILCQAHVFEAKQIENACLSFIKDHTAEVLKLQAYADLSKKWPEVAMKIHLFSAGVPETEAAAIVQASKVRRLENGKERTL